MRTGIFAALLLGSVSANATLITIEPDDFEDQTNISSLIPNVTLATGIHVRDLDGVPTHAIAGPIRAVEQDTSYGPEAATGTKIFGGTDGHRMENPDHGPYPGPFLWASFDTPVDYVSFLWLGVRCASWGCHDAPSMLVYDEHDNLITNCWFGQAEGCAQQFVGLATVDSDVGGDPYGRGIFEISFSAALLNVGSVKIGGTAFIDRMQFNTVDTVAVPEPGTLAIFSLGVAFLLLHRRRRPDR